jgi:hypothetical protein
LKIILPGNYETIFLQGHPVCSHFEVVAQSGQIETVAVRAVNRQVKRSDGTFRYKWQWHEKLSLFSHFRVVYLHHSSDTFL